MTTQKNKEKQIAEAWKDFKKKEQVASAQAYAALQFQHTAWDVYRKKVNKILASK